MKVHFNQEYIAGFIDAILAEYSRGVFPILKTMVNHEVTTFFKGNKVSVTIRFSLKTDDKTYNLHFEMTDDVSISEFSIVVDELIQKIDNHIRKFLTP